MEPRTRNILIGVGVVLAAAGGILLWKKTAEAKEKSLPLQPGTGSLPEGTTAQTGTEVQAYTPPDTTAPTASGGETAVDTAALRRPAKVDLNWKDPNALYVTDPNPGPEKYPTAKDYCGLAGTALTKYKEAALKWKKWFLANVNWKVSQRDGWRKWWGLNPNISVNDLNVKINEAYQKAYNALDQYSEDQQLMLLSVLDCPDTVYASLREKGKAPPAVLTGWILANLESEAKLAVDRANYDSQILVPLTYSDKDWYNWPEEKRIKYVYVTCRKG